MLTCYRILLIRFPTNSILMIMYIHTIGWHSEDMDIDNARRRISWIECIIWFRYLNISCTVEWSLLCDTSIWVCILSVGVGVGQRFIYVRWNCTNVLQICDISTANLVTVRKLQSMQYLQRYPVDSNSLTSILSDGCCWSYAIVYCSMSNKTIWTTRVNYWRLFVKTQNPLVNVNICKTSCAMRTVIPWYGHKHGFS